MTLYIFWHSSVCFSGGGGQQASQDPSPAECMARPPPAKPTWTELKTHVRTTRRDLSSLSARVPTLFSFRTMPSDPNHIRYVVRIRITITWCKITSVSTPEFLYYLITGMIWAVFYCTYVWTLLLHLKVLF